MMSVDTSEAQMKEKEASPDVGVPLHVQVVEVVGALRSTEVGSLQPLDDLVFHHPGDTSGSSSAAVEARQMLRVTVCEKQVMALAIMAPLMEKGSMV
ncbi:hypothetical protein EYF80_014249 [Liparis tanakae]|uniref:Uncharacterized protein n=1 Tax=Liparis tanakae TaxID=230148 RepID=A0A4Z2IBT4_9TELE|nr:hypothetical protein EYF80_014249 [Liparis tanakae]